MSDEEENGTKVRFDMSHLSQEEQAEEADKIENDVTYDVTPKTTDHSSENRSNPIPGTKAPEPPKLKKKEITIREPRRSSRPRADIPRRYRE